MKLKSKDLILHLLNSHGKSKHEPIVGITRLQKMIFLFEKEIWPEFKFDRVIAEEELPKFEPYFFGPFSETVNSDVEFLISLNFIKPTVLDVQQFTDDEKDEIDFLNKKDLSIKSSELLTTKFELSSKGLKFVSVGRAGALAANQQNVLNQFKLKCNSVPLKALLKYVYVKYPEMTSKSHIKKDILDSNA